MCSWFILARSLFPSEVLVSARELSALVLWYYDPYQHAIQELENGYCEWNSRQCFVFNNNNIYTVE